LPRVLDPQLGERPTEYDLWISDPFGIGGDLDTKVEWRNIQYSDTDIRMQDVKFGLADYEGAGLFTIDFPAFREFTIRARQTVLAWFWPVTNTEVELSFKDFDLDF
jgi:hypothetical protein